MFCGGNWMLIGICALSLGVSIVIVALFPVCFLMILIAVVLILCGVGLLKRR